MPDASMTVKRPRELGAHYTPSFITRFMLRSCLSGPLAGRVGDNDEPLRLLDPACGDGAFLVEALDELRQQHPHRSRTELTSRHLYGVDIDPHAIAQLERRLRGQVVAKNIRCGNALSGPDFQSTQQTDGDGLVWTDAFPRVAKAGGFDLVIGNPPYVREKDAKRLFDQLADTELGRRYRQPRMDLWHYFLHRGLDLLRPCGVLCFIVNSYWTAAVSARPLIERLAAETTVRQLVLLGDTPLFAGVSGRHMILQVQKGRSDEDCHILDLTHCDDVEAMFTRFSEVGEIVNGRRGPSATLLTRPSQSKLEHQCIESHRPQEALFDRGRLQMAAPSIVNAGQSHTRLVDTFEVRQGIAENPPFVTRRMADESNGRLETGSGVFVLTTEEIDRIAFSDEEHSLLRPYYVTRSCGRFHLPEQPTHWLLYLTPETCPDIGAVPRIARHLEQVRPVLERRREVLRGAIQWWHLHWPRRERLFNEPRILAVQMGRKPQFVYAEAPTYVGFSINLVQSTAASPLSLPALTAILNSRSSDNWFRANAKWRGVALDISGAVLRDFPIPDLSPCSLGRLEELCLRRQSSIPSEHQSIEDQIELLIPGAPGT